MTAVGGSLLRFSKGCENFDMDKRSKPNSTVSAAEPCGKRSDWGSLVLLFHARRKRVCVVWVVGEWEEVERACLFRADKERGKWNAMV